MGLATIREDHHRNRIYLTLLGLFEDAELVELTDRLVEASARQTGGFDLVNDITGCLPVSPQGVLIIKDLQKRLRAAGVRRVVRIVGDAVVPNLQLSLHAEDVGYRAATATTAEGAERLLEHDAPE
jgi:hypothetical protein